MVTGAFASSSGIAQDRTLSGMHDYVFVTLQKLLHRILSTCLDNFWQWKRYEDPELLAATPAAAPTAPTTEGDDDCLSLSLSRSNSELLSQASQDSNSINGDDQVLSDDDSRKTARQVLNSWGQTCAAADVPVLILPAPIAYLIFSGAWHHVLIRTAWHQRLVDARGRKYISKPLFHGTHRR